MGWITRKLDTLGGAASGGAGGMGLSQAPAFTQAYLQRLGGHIDEARRTLDGVQAGTVLPRLPADLRAEAVDDLAARVAELETARAAIMDAAPALRPMVMLRHADATIASRALDHFTPALPLDGASLIYTGAGVVLALLLYEVIKAPALLFRRRPA